MRDHATNPISCHHFRMTQMEIVSVCPKILQNKMHIRDGRTDARSHDGNHTLILAVAAVSPLHCLSLLLMIDRHYSGIEVAWTSKGRLVVGLTQPRAHFSAPPCTSLYFALLVCPMRFVIIVIHHSLHRTFHDAMLEGASTINHC